MWKATFPYMARNIPQKLGLNCMKLQCSLPPITSSCPSWMQGTRGSQVSSLSIESNYDITVTPAVSYSAGILTCQYVEESLYIVDVNITLPLSKFGWIHRGIMRKVGKKGTIEIEFTPSPGMCLRPSGTSATAYECQTPILNNQCPGWFQGSWKGIYTTGHHAGLNSTFIVNGTYAALLKDSVDGEGTYLLKCGELEGNSINFDMRAVENGRYIRGVAAFYENGTLQLQRGPLGWCTRARAKEDHDSLSDWPFFSLQYTCATPLLSEMCPSWLDGEWQMESTRQSWHIDGTLSEEKLKVGTVLCSTSNKSEHLINLDVTSRSEKNYTVIERKVVKLESTYPVSTLTIITSPKNWCSRYAASSATAECATPPLDGTCPTWLQGRWKFFPDLPTVKEAHVWTIYGDKLVSIENPMGETIRCKELDNNLFQLDSLWQ